MTDSREEKEKESVHQTQDLRLLLRLWTFVRPYKWTFAAALFCLPLTSICLLLQPLLLMRAIDVHIAAGDLSGVLETAGIYAVVMLAEFVFLYAQYYLTMIVAQKSLADLRVAVFERVQRLSASYFDRHPVGGLVTRMTTDIDAINEMFAAGALAILMDVFTLLGIVAIMVAIDWRLAVVALAILPLLLIAINFFRIQARRSYRAIREHLGRLNGHLQEAISGMSILQLYGQEERSAKQFLVFNDANRRATHRTNIYEASLFSMIESGNSICIALVLWYGGTNIIGETLALGALVAFIEYIHRFFVPIRDFSNKYAVMQSAITAAERVFHLLDTEIEIEGPLRPETAPVAEGRIEFRNVWFAYRGEDWVLKDLSFRAGSGESLAFVGPTGSGKTTIIKLLNRTYDVQKGSVLVDGRDVREWDPRLLRRRIGVVLQDVFLFTGKVIDNLTLGRDDVSRERALEAARAVHVDSFVESIPGGFDGELQERGANLSVGQRQLLSFARALAYDPAILVLDEATSSVDPETEALIEEASRKLTSGRTSLVIAHRLATVERADRILVLQHGEVHESGTHEELLQHDGLYRRLYELQYAQQAA